MRFLQKSKTPFNEEDFLTLDDRIVKSAASTLPDRDMNGVPIRGISNGLPPERPTDIQLLENEAVIQSILMKAAGESQHVQPSFYEGSTDVYIDNKKVVDVTVTEANRRAIHTISNYYNTLGIYRDDFVQSDNDKLARNAYYAICEKAMMDYMRSVQWTIKDNKDGEPVEKALDFFETPNPQDAFPDILAMYIRDLTRYDAAVITKSFNKGGFVNEIKCYLSTEFWREQDRVPFIINVPVTNTVDLTGGAYASHQQPSYQGWWSHGYTERFWQRSRTGVYIPFQPEEISYGMMYPRTDGIYGTDFIKFLKYQIQYLIDSTKAAGKTFENGVVPSIVWEHPEVHTVQQLKQRIAELKTNNQGWQRFGSTIHTVNGEKVTSLAQSLHDMQWLEGQKFVAQLVWAMWGFSPEEFMGGGENRATAYVKRNITKSRLLYPLMTFIEGKVNKDILPYIKGYRNSWKFKFIRDIDLDDEQKVSTTNSIKASTFLQYFTAGFPMKASFELAGLDADSYKLNIEELEIEVMENQMAMLGQQAGEGQMEPGDTEEGRYNGDGSYVDTDLGTNEQGSAQSKNDPRDPAIDEEQYKKAGEPTKRKKLRGSYDKHGVWESAAEKEEAAENRRAYPKSSYSKANIKSNGKKDTREDMDYPPKELHMGISVEMEHTDDPEIAKEIAKDHLDEDKEYYSKLKKMESTFKKSDEIVKDKFSDNQRNPISSLGGKLGGEKGLYLNYTLEQKRNFKTAREEARKKEAIRQKTEGYDSEEPGTEEVYKDKAGITKAKVYIAHPSEAPRGRSVRRGVKGGYYYITTEQHRGGEKGTAGKQAAKKKKKGGGKGWETGGEKRGDGAGEVQQPPDIEGASETIHISGKGVGLALGIIGGRLVAKKLPNKATQIFIKKMELLAGERAEPEKTIEAAIAIAEDEGLKIS